MKSINILYSLFFLLPVFSYAVREELSFSAPFKSYSYDGKRKIENWQCNGDAVINEYFVRLTPDRQSKSGNIWSYHRINDGEFVTTIKFRISGQGSSLYGDGFTVFFTQNPSPIPGKMHGISDHFYGFAITFSTFTNADFSRYHRDVAVYLSYNKDEPAYTQDQDHTGCYSHYRFHEKRQDFSVDNYAVVKIGYSEREQIIRVSIDEKNTGSFQTCFTEKTTFAPNWWAQAYIGISASTGQLADNHDILSLETVTGEGNPDNVKMSKSKEVSDVEAQEDDAFNNMMTKHSINIDGLDSNSKGLIQMIRHLDRKQKLDVSKLKRELEHRIVAADESLNNMLKKVEKSTDISESRIHDIEQSLKKDVQSSMIDKLDKRVKTVEEVFSDHLQQAVQHSNKNWKIPFAVLIIIIGGILLVVYGKYKHALKTRLL